MRYDYICQDSNNKMKFKRFNWCFDSFLLYTLLVVRTMIYRVEYNYTFLYTKGYQLSYIFNTWLNFYRWLQNAAHLLCFHNVCLFYFQVLANGIHLQAPEQCAHSAHYICFCAWTLILFMRTVRCLLKCFALQRHNIEL
jgi:hypothetical protein